MSNFVGNFWRLVESTSLKFECAHDENRRPFYWTRRAEMRKQRGRGRGRAQRRRGRKQNIAKRGKHVPSREENVVIVLF